ncbi:MAG: iron-sulfur cluster assembly scaffold protein [Cellulosilyticaceae bacterium]
MQNETCTEDGMHCCGAFKDSNAQCGTFTNKVLEHFMMPRNCGIMEDANGEGTFGDPSCGDYLTIQIKVEDNKIEDIKFLVFGCTAAVASSSMTTVLAKGKTLEEALQITDKDITEALDGLPEHKVHCSVLGAGALKNAIQDYYAKVNNAK